MTYAVAAGNETADAKQPRPGRLRRGDHRLGAGRLQRPARRRRRAATCRTDHDDTFANASQLRRRHRPDRPRRLHPLDLGRAAARHHQRHLDGKPARGRRGGPLQGRQPRSQPGPGQGGPAKRGQPELERRRRPRPHQGAAPHSTPLLLQRRPPPRGRGRGRAAAGTRLQSAPWAVTSQRGRAGWRPREAALAARVASAIALPVVAAPGHPGFTMQADRARRSGSAGPRFPRTPTLSSRLAA